jgi:glycerate dehydrogenase
MVDAPLPRIVVLDGHTLLSRGGPPPAHDPGDLSWGPLAALGVLEVHERTRPELLLERARGAPLLLTNKTPIDGAAIAQLPDLRYIGVLATGTNIVDVAAARARGIVVSNVPDYGADSVAEHTLALMLEASKHLARHLAAARDGGWSAQPDFSFSVSEIRLLAGRTLGVVGLGAIGRRVAELARAFKMTVLAARREGDTSRPESDGQIRRCTLDEMLRAADFVSLHCPLTEQTQRLINAERLARMKPGAILINTARGALVDEPALAAALRSGSLAAAYLDVLGVEPPPAAHPLLGLPNCWITPHVAWASQEARGRLMDIAVRNVQAFLAGTPIHVVL